MKPASSLILTLVAPGYFAIEGGYDALNMLLDLPRAADGGVRDLRRDRLRCAVGGARARCRVPGELSIIGVDDHDIAPVVGLTTVHQDVPEHGAHAARMVFDILTGTDAPADAPERADQTARAQHDCAARMSALTPGLSSRLRVVTRGRRSAGSRWRRRCRWCRRPSPASAGGSGRRRWPTVPCLLDGVGVARVDGGGVDPEVHHDLRARAPRAVDTSPLMTEPSRTFEPNAASSKSSGRTPRTIRLPS